MTALGKRWAICVLYQYSSVHDRPNTVLWLQLENQKWILGEDMVSEQSRIHPVHSHTPTYGKPTSLEYVVGSNSSLHLAIEAKEHSSWGETIKQNNLIDVQIHTVSLHIHLKPEIRVFLSEQAEKVARIPRHGYHVNNEGARLNAMGGVYAMP